MKEIEIKAVLRDKDEIIKKLSARGCVFEPMITQEDQIFVEKVGSIEIYHSNRAVLRIRTKNKSKIIFTAKKRMENNLEAIEHEVEVSSADEMEKALLMMGYQEAVRVNKTRIITHYNGCEICIDDVENLGAFIEMEKLTPDGNAKEIQEELFKFFESIGISRADRVLVGYDILTLMKNSK